MIQFCGESAAVIYHDDRHVIRLSNSYLIVHDKVDGKEVRPLGYLEGTNLIKLPK